MRRQVKLAVLAAGRGAVRLWQRRRQRRPAVVEPVTAEQVQTIAENMLAAYNSGLRRLQPRSVATREVDRRRGNLRRVPVREPPGHGSGTYITNVQADPGRQDADHTSYVVHARFEHQNVVTVHVTVSRSGEVDGLELYPKDG